MSFIYNNKINNHSQEAVKFKRVAFNLMISRVVFFILIIAGIYFYWGNLAAIILVIVIGGLLFGRLVILNHKAINDQRFHEALVKINQRELTSQKSLFFSENASDVLSPKNHDYALDLDILGHHSIFNWVDRTISVVGLHILAQKFLNPNLNPLKIKDNQNALKELAGKLDWRQNFEAIGTLEKLKGNEEKMFREWVQERVVDLPQWKKLLNYIFPVLALVNTWMYITDVIGLPLFLAYFLVPLFYVTAHVKKTVKQAEKITKVVSFLSTLARLFEHVENEEFKNEHLQDVQGKIKDQSYKVSSAVNQLAGFVAKYEQRSNLLIGLALNAFFVWDLQYVVRFNHWKNTYQKQLPNWIHALGEFDALNSLANTIYNNPNFVFPELADNTFVFKAEDLKHPLMKNNACVGNNFESVGSGNMAIITGANMAGKSTFLRTVGVNLVLANMGMPVFASSFEYSPIAVFTSMRTQDSLSEHLSFFHAELSRLKQLSDLLNDGEQRFIILDEILKGTNSKDKALGSAAFLKKIINYPVMGLIATHDLSLCELAEKYPKQISNMHFEVAFKGNDVIFDYKLDQGVCKNMNASFLLKKMGIVEGY